MAGCLGTLTALDEPLHETEKRGIEQMAPVRFREFVAGRTAAHRAIGQLTGAVAPVPRNADRSPSWPAGLCGSLSHSRHYAIGVVARLAQYRSIGVDIEEDWRVEEDLWDQVLTPAERDWLGGLPPSAAQRAAALMFSAKEAYFKCLPRRFQEQVPWLAADKIETSVALASATVTCAVPHDTSLPVLQGCFRHFDRHWITLFYLAPHHPSG
jgi:4'-phosphopantetheinyl transferase EntD